MPLPTSDIHRLWPVGSIQKRELPFQLHGVAWLDPRLRSRLKELLNALMPETLDRPTIVYRNATLYTCFLRPGSKSVPKMGAPRVAGCPIHARSHRAWVGSAPATPPAPLAEGPSFDATRAATEMPSSPAPPNPAHPVPRNLENLPKAHPPKAFIPHAVRLVILRDAQNLGSCFLGALRSLSRKIAARRLSSPPKQPSPTKQST
jgi:hypothetical protein